MKREFMELLRSEIFLEITNENKLVVIEEKNKDDENSLRKVTISGIPEGSVAFSLDHNPSKELISKLGKDGFRKLSWLINDRHKNANKKCDYVIVSPLKGVHKILIGELKSSHMKEKDYRYQLVNSMLFVKYVVSMIRRYHSYDLVPSYKFTLLTNIRKNAYRQKKPLVNQSKRLFEGEDDPYIKIWRVLKGNVKYEDIA